VPAPPHLQGRSLWPVLRNQPAPARRSALLEHTGWRTIRTSRYRYVLHDDGRELLWDLDQPLGEYHDLAASPEHADTLAGARLELARRMIELERPLPRTWPY
jgi:arylsulfatase A-like enzyme